MYLYIRKLFKNNLKLSKMENFKKGVLVELKQNEYNLSKFALVKGKLIGYVIKNKGTKYCGYTDPVQIQILRKAGMEEAIFDVERSELTLLKNK